MEFAGAMAEAQQALAACEEHAERRRLILNELKLRRGERVLELGCGSGLMLREIGMELGPHGLAAGIDLSEDQIAAATEECAGVPAVRPAVGSATAIDYPDASFDAGLAIQVLEYVPDVALAVAELARVLKPSGRLHLLAVNWQATSWHGPPADLTAEITGAWIGHAAHPNLSAQLPAMLRANGFESIRQAPLAIINAEYGSRGFAYWLARMMAIRAVEQGVAKDRADSWIATLDQAERDGEFFFSSLPVLTSAIRKAG